MIKNMNVLIGLKRLYHFTATENHPAPVKEAIDAAINFVNTTETPLDHVKVGLNEGFPVMYYTKSFSGYNIVRLRVTEDSYILRTYKEDEDNTDVLYETAAEAAAAVNEALMDYIETESSAPPSRAFKKPRRKFRDEEERPRFKKRRGDAPSFRRGTVKSFEDLGEMVERN